MRAAERQDAQPHIRSRLRALAAPPAAMSTTLGGVFASGDCERRDQRQTVNRGGGCRDRVRRASKADME